ncbi:MULTISPECIES: T9SS type A sorting domain-containing protein [Flavobacterium]|uniref:T9SS type A sorting domain-containing protein n=1 Tax=Flavobacterium TaxID=237 RepID=UPI001FCA6950|nr:MULTISPECIES: T9SS type A sorting domain-containing protein [Flavobacterium]UOK42914.1 T9SS type A sorting domain-containing protein [Flavobacterium enshiense]
MKTLFTLVLILSVTYNVYSQVLYNENFESYTAGDFADQATSIAYGSPYDAFEVIQDGTGKRLSIRPDCILYINLEQWPLRNSGNNVLEVEFDYFTGPDSDFTARGGLALLADQTQTIGVMMRYNSKVVYAANNLSQERELGDGNTSVVLPKNVWLRLMFSYNTVTREAIFKGPGFYKVFPDFTQANNYTRYWVGYLGYPAYPIRFNYDNVVVKAVPSSTLGTEVSLQGQEGLQLYPNPATDYVMVETSDKILNVYIYDVEGKRSELVLNDGKIDISQFPAGNYIVGLKTDKGFVSQKIIKR